MRVLHLCHSDVNGGAARAAYRLHLAQRRYGIDSHMLVVDKGSVDDFVHTVSGGRRLRIKVANFIARQLLKLQNSANAVHHSLGSFSSGIASDIERISPDIVNLHWVSGEMISVREISKIMRPVVWTLHDMWVFCGAEHYEDPKFSGRYILGYDSERRDRESFSGVDIDAHVWRTKKKRWAAGQLNFVCPSHWLAKCLKESALLSNAPVVVVPNCINHETYRPVDRLEARQELGLPLDQRIILFGAVSSSTDPRKGYAVLVEALQKLSKNMDGVCVVIFGAQSGEIEQKTGFQVHYMGSIYDETLLAKLYAAADLFVAPSSQDNLPNTLVESLACGTPCVAFSIGGMPDLIDDPKMGELVIEVGSVDALAEGLAKGLMRKFCSKQIAERSAQIRSESKVVAQYKKVYETLLGEPL